MEKVFISSFLIAGRESMEISMVLGAIIKYLKVNKINTRKIWFVALVAGIISILFGFLTFYFGNLIPKEFLRFVTILMGIRLIYLAFEKQKDEKGLPLVSFFAVLREGIEITVLSFLSGGIHPLGLLLGLILGFSTGLIFKSNKIGGKGFLKTTLLLIGIYLVVHGFGII